jgi:hypothetical protein
VWAWRALAEHLAESVTVGQPLLMRGQLRVRDTERDGRIQLTAEILALCAGATTSPGAPRSSTGRFQPATNLPTCLIIRFLWLPRRRERPFHDHRLITISIQKPDVTRFLGTV